MPLQTELSPSPAHRQQDHTPAASIAHFTDRVPHADRSNLGLAMQEGLEAKGSQVLTRATFHQSETQAALAGQMVTVFMNGSWQEISLRQYLGKGLHRMAHPAEIVAVGGPDVFFMPDGTVGSFQATDADLIMEALGEKSGVVTSMGPSARSATKSSPAAEVYEVKVVRGGASGRSAVLSQGISVGEHDEVTIAQIADGRREVLQQTARFHVSERPLADSSSEQPFALIIEGGNGITPLEAQLQETLARFGIINAAYTIHVEGEDFQTRAAVVTQLPDPATGVTDGAHLAQLQQPFTTTTGGTLEVVGVVTPHHPDGGVRSAVNKPYTKHSHAIGRTSDGQPTDLGGHINGIVLGANSRAVIMIRPIAHVVEIDAATIKGTTSEARQIPGFDHPDFADFFGVLIPNAYGPAIIHHARTLHMNAVELTNMYRETDGNMQHLLRALQRREQRSQPRMPFIQGRLRSALAQFAADQREGMLLSHLPLRDLVAMERRRMEQQAALRYDLTEQRPPIQTAEVWNQEALPWEAIVSQITQIEQTVFGEQADADLQELFTDPSAVVILQRARPTVEFPDGQIIGYVLATNLAKAKAVDREENGTSSPADLPGDEQFAYVWSAAVLPEFRQTGVATEMLTALEERLREQGYRFVDTELTVADQSGQQLLRSLRSRFGKRLTTYGPPHTTELGPQQTLRIDLARGRSERRSLTGPRVSQPEVRHIEPTYMPPVVERPTIQQILGESNPALAASLGTVQVSVRPDSLLQGVSPDTNQERALGILFASGNFALDVRRLQQRFPTLTGIVIHQIQVEETIPSSYTISAFGRTESGAQVLLETAQTRTTRTVLAS